MTRRGSVVITTLVGLIVIGAVMSDVAERIPYVNSILNLAWGGLFLKMWRTMATREDVENLRLEIGRHISSVASKSTTVILDVEERLTGRVERAEGRIDELWQRPERNRRG
jgi:hypothetical protein